MNTPNDCCEHRKGALCQYESLESMLDLSGLERDQFLGMELGCGVARLR